MKTKLAHIIAVLVLSSSVQAANLTANPMKDLFNDIQKAEFAFKEVGMVFGFETIKSCFYSSDDLLVIKNYCVPKKSYPAKGYTLISKKYGIMDLYQEKMSPKLVKKDLLITVFPEYLIKLLDKELSEMSLSDVNGLLEDFYYENTAACWSTNYSHADEAPVAMCNVPTTRINGYEAWATETQTFVNDESQWNAIIEKLENQFRD